MFFSSITLKFKANYLFVFYAYEVLVSRYYLVILIDKFLKVFHLSSYLYMGDLKNNVKFYI